MHKGVKMSFSINCLEINVPAEERNKNLYKNLSSRRYFFNDYYIQDDFSENLVRNKHSIQNEFPNFYGKNINIQAIVGLNGSGKSSILDLMFIIINNFSYMFERGHDRSGAESLCFVDNVEASLYYSIESVEYKILCDKDRVYFQKRETDKVPFENIELFQLNDSRVIKGYDWSSEVSCISNIAKKFFYTIVSNYSIQSFIPSNYKCSTHVYNHDEKKDDLSWNVNSYGYSWDEDRDKNDNKEKIWINSIFHKNDGYVRSIVLNPYRHKGSIDMENELELSKYRIIAQLIDAENKGNPFFDDYELDCIHYELDEDYIKRKFNVRNINAILRKIDSEIENPESEISAIIVSFGIRVLTFDSTYRERCQENGGEYDSRYEKASPKSQRIALLYLKQKLEKIVRLYDVYHDFRYGEKQSIFDENFEVRKTHLIALCCAIDKDPSHIATKIKQVVHFLRKDSHEKNIAWVDWKRGFNYKKYKSSFESEWSSIDDIVNTLPPRIFKYDVFLKKGNEKGINLARLSSGEHQMFQTISTHFYHIRNLLSVPENRIKYQNINLVFDEAELCFHMEFQRVFINRLIKTLNALIEKKSTTMFNVIFITHSPFLLSDILNSHLLYLDKGVAKENKHQKTFAANLNDLVKNTFFLKNGFIGAYAQEKIKSLVSFIKSKRHEDYYWNIDKAKLFISDVISEPIIRECLLLLLRKERGV